MHKGGGLSVSGARRLPKCDTFADRRVCFCRLWFTLNVAVVVIIPTAVNIFRARVRLCSFPPCCAVELVGPNRPGWQLVQLVTGGSQEGLVYYGDLRGCGGDSPGGRNVPC